MIISDGDGLTCEWIKFS